MYFNLRTSNLRKISSVSEDFFLPLMQRFEWLRELFVWGLCFFCSFVELTPPPLPTPPHTQETFKCLCLVSSLLLEWHIKVKVKQLSVFLFMFTRNVVIYAVRCSHWHQKDLCVWFYGEHCHLFSFTVTTRLVLKTETRTAAHWCSRENPVKTRRTGRQRGPTEASSGNEMPS